MNYVVSLALFIAGIAIGAAAAWVVASTNIYSLELQVESLSKYKTLVDELEKDKSRLQQLVDELRRNNTELRRSIAALTTELEGLREEVDGLSRTVEEQDLLLGRYEYVLLGIDVEGSAWHGPTGNVTLRLNNRIINVVQLNMTIYSGTGDLKCSGIVFVAPGDPTAYFKCGEEIDDGDFLELGIRGFSKRFLLQGGRILEVP